MDTYILAIIEHLELMHSFYDFNKKEEIHYQKALYNLKKILKEIDKNVFEEII